MRRATFLSISAPSVRRTTRVICTNGCALQKARHSSTFAPTNATRFVRLPSATAPIRRELIARVYDPSPWLAVSEALRFLPTLVEGGWAEVMRRNHTLVLRAREILCDALRIEKPAPDDMLGAMASVSLPDGEPTPLSPLSIDPLQDALLERFSIEVPVMQWPSPPKRVLRVSAQLYNTVDEYDQLADALHQLL